MPVAFEGGRALGDAVRVLDDAGSEFKKTADTAVVIGTEVAKEAVSSVDTVYTLGKDLGINSGSAAKNATDTAEDGASEISKDFVAGAKVVGHTVETFFIQSEVNSVH